MADNSKKESRRLEALKYHSEGRPGKIEVVPTKPYSSQYDLTLAYSPGVAEPCLEIEENPEDVYKYTAKGNLVAVISNGTAVLGLGDIGPAASKPVMEGKGLLFKTFADIDVFDIEIDSTNVDEFIDTVKNIAPTFGGINLEDIKAPECFEIEDRLREELDIPVMHDDQHGTAIISAAALLNALHIVNKKIENVKVVVNGAGAAAVSCARLYLTMGVKAENLVMCDSKGVINAKRTDLNETKKEFATKRDLDTLEESIKDADVFLGLSVAGVLSQDMVRTMASNPVVMALANPNPEIDFEDAMASRPDIIFATGRSDYPNQVNNVLGFPYIFRGALDVRASKINEEMKIAAAKALAELARQPVPESVSSAYRGENIRFGKEYLIPKALDPRLIVDVSIAVAKAAIDSGVARKRIEDWDKYKVELSSRMGRDNKLFRRLRGMVESAPKKRVLFSEGDTLETIKTAISLASDNLMHPIIVGERHEIDEHAAKHNLDLSEIEIIDFRTDVERDKRQRYADILVEKMSRRGITPLEALKSMKQRDMFALVAMLAGDADLAIVGYNRKFDAALEPVRQLFNATEKTLATMHIVTTKSGPMFFADTSVNNEITAEQFVEITNLVAEEVRRYGIEPVIALLSNSNFGTHDEVEAETISEAVGILHKDYPELLVDGEMDVDIALNIESRTHYYPFNKLKDNKVNTFIFPDATSANIAYNLMGSIGDSDVNGPVLLGLGENIHLQQETADQRSQRNLAVIAASMSNGKNENKE